MKLWHHLPEPGEYWRFDRLVEDVDFKGPMAAANAVFTALWPVVRPLSVTLNMKARRRHDCPLSAYKIPLPVVRVWHLREVEVSAPVAVAEWLKAYKPSQQSEEERPELTLQALADWLARAHAQLLPEGYVPVLGSLYVHSTRARLLAYQELYAELALGPKTSVIPVEKREDGLWVSGPMPDTMINPPIEIDLLNTNELHKSVRMTLRIFVGWSPWVETGSAEAELLTACLHELEKQGWR